MNNFYEIIEKNQKLEKPALVDDLQSIGYKDLFVLCNNLSSYLASKEIRKGDRIAIFLPNSIEFALGFFSCLNIGAIAVPINPKFKKNEIEYYINDSDPKLILTSDILKTVLLEVNNELSNKIVCLKGEGVDLDIFNHKYLGDKLNINSINENYIITFNF